MNKIFISKNKDVDSIVDYYYHIFGITETDGVIYSTIRNEWEYEGQISSNIIDSQIRDIYCRDFCVTRFINTPESNESVESVIEHKILSKLSELG